MRLRDLHRTSALFIASFAALHIANHLVSLHGIATHIAFMEAARVLYRQPLVEGLLLICVGFQLGSGLWFLIRDWKSRSGLVPWLQAGSGAYLAFFLLVHVAAVLFGRAALQLDTNFHYAAAGLHVPPYQLFFAPYYFLAVLALFTHLGCAAYWRLEAAPGARKDRVLGAAIAAGALLATLIVLSLAGKIQPVEIPLEYKATYAGPPD